MQENTTLYKNKKLFNEFVRLNSIIDLNYNSRAVKGKFTKLQNQLKVKNLLELPLRERVLALLDIFYNQWGFCCNPNNQFNLDRMMLDVVLEKREGMPFTLSALLISLAEKINIKIYPIAFPTQFILRAEVEKSSIFINPLDGEILTTQTLSTLLKGYMGFGSILKAEYLQILLPEVLFRKIEQNFKTALMNEGYNIEALWLVESLLKEMPKDPYEIRDRGLILVSLDCIQAAMNDFDYFIEQCPNDPMVKFLQAQIQGFPDKQPLIH